MQLHCHCGIFADHDPVTRIVVQDDGHKEKRPATMEWVKSKARNACSKKQLYKKLPIFDWLPKYDLGTGVADLIAGITVGLTVIPQGIAYAIVANLPPQVIQALSDIDFANIV